MIRIKWDKHFITIHGHASTPENCRLFSFAISYFINIADSECLVDSGTGLLKFDTMKMTKDDLYRLITLLQLFEINVEELNKEDTENESKRIKENEGPTL